MVEDFHPMSFSRKCVFVDSHNTATAQAARKLIEQKSIMFKLLLADTVLLIVDFQFLAVIIWFVSLCMLGKIQPCRLLV
jgi:hypothetical protein